MNNCGRTNVWIKCSTGEMIRLSLFSHSALRVPKQLSAGESSSIQKRVVLVSFNDFSLWWSSPYHTNQLADIGGRGGRIGGRGKRKRCQPSAAAGWKWKTVRLGTHKNTIHIQTNFISLFLVFSPMFENEVKMKYLTWKVNVLTPKMSQIFVSSLTLKKMKLLLETLP